MAEIKYMVKGGVRYTARFQYQGRPITKSGFRLKREAKEWIAEEKKRLKKKPTPTDGGFSNLANWYLDDCNRYLTKNTVRSKQHISKQLILSAGGDFELNETSEWLVATYINSIKNPKTANRHLRELKALFNWGIQKGVIVSNPTSGIRKFPEKKYVPYVPPPEDIAAVTLIAPPMEQAILETYQHTAARLSEVLNLTWDDVNFDAGWVRLWTRKRKGGNKEPRVLKINDALRATLTRQWNTRHRQSPYVFVNPETETRYKRDEHFIRHMLKRLCKKAGVKPFGFHAIRHRVASILQDSGKASIREIQRFLGHQRITTTEAYLHDLEIVGGGKILEKAFGKPKVGNEGRQLKTGGKKQHAV